MSTHRRWFAISLTALVMMPCAFVSAHGGEEEDETEREARRGPTIVMDLPVATQGPPWPPSETIDEEGNFILLGSVLEEIDGTIALVPEQAVLVSKDTVPPLDDQGVEDPDNWFGATYDVLRPLDLSEGSTDLDLVLYSNSFGPAVGSGRSPRIPRIGDGPYNLNGDLIICPDHFPAESQKLTYTRPSFPLHEVPVAGFQGDGVAYDLDSGEPYDPMTASDDPSCAATGCPGEDAVDKRSTKPITLGDWVKSKGRLKITLTQPNENGDYTHARFKFHLRNMLPNGVYTV